MKKAKLNIPICAALVLLFLTMVSIHMTSGLYARYTTQDSGGDAARVISFSRVTLDETGDFYESNKLRIIPGHDLTKRAQISFGGSESATYIFVEVSVSAANSLWSVSADGKTFSVHDGVMTWAVADGWTFLKQSGSSYIYYLSLLPNTALESKDFIADEGKITISDQITKAIIKTMLDITINFQATAVQSGGFDSPAAAWASISN